MKKIHLIFLGLFLLVGSVFAIGYGYTHKNGSKVFFDDNGKIIGIEDESALMSRYPSREEIEKNDYIPLSLGECLTTRGVVFYGAYWCSHCADQKKMFGFDIKNVNYFECERNKQYCINKGVKAYPTWEIKGNLYQGVKSLDELSRLSDCPI